MTEKAINAEIARIRKIMDNSDSAFIKATGLKRIASWEKMRDPAFRKREAQFRVATANSCCGWERYSLDANDNVIDSLDEKAW